MSVVEDPAIAVVNRPAVFQRGARELRTGIMAFLALAVPPALAASRVEWSLAPDDLPDPNRYDPFESEAQDVLPSLSLGLARARGYGRTDVDESGGGHEYQVRYTARVYTWYAGEPPADADSGEPEQNPTLAARDDYAQVVLGCLLATPSLLSSRIRVLEETLDVTWSDAARLRGDRRLAGASVAFDVLHTESIRRVPLGIAAEVQVDTTVGSEE